MGSSIKKQNPKAEEYTMGFGKVNLISILIMIPLTALIVSPFILIWDYETLKTGKEILNDDILLYLIGGIVIHELLHGLTWGYFASSGFKSIKFGVKWKYLTPYCHCKEPLKVKHYKIGGAMPLVIMGIIPSIIGIIIGHGGVLTFGIIFTWAAGGDIIALFMLRRFDNEVYVSDHPSKIGYLKS